MNINFNERGYLQKEDEELGNGETMYEEIGGNKTRVPVITRLQVIISIYSVYIHKSNVF